MDVELIVTPGLGDNTYLVTSGGEAVVIDPQRDVERFLEAAEGRDASIIAALETHVHNDYVSGAKELHERIGAEVAGPAKGRYEFPVRPLSEGSVVRLGDLRLVAAETPGHTPEHLSYLLYEDDGDAPAAIFTGGSLMVGGAGRTDLLGPAHTDELTRAQFHTLRRLASFPDDVRVFPTHGAGSFCGAGPAPRQRTATLGEERRRNRALLAPDEEAFLRQQLSGLLAYPTYYAAMAPINRAGPPTLGGLPRPRPRPLTPEAFERLAEGGTVAVDGRRRAEFAAAHIPGSLNVELANDFGSYVGWTVRFGSSLMLVLPDPEDEALHEALTQLIRIGYDRTLGYLAGGVDAWRRAGRPVRSYPLATVMELCREIRAGTDPMVLDVRQRVEWDRGHIPGSRHLFVGDIPAREHEIAGHDEVWAICATGHRSSIAASLLDRAGIPVRLVTGGGVEEWLANCGKP